MELLQHIVHLWGTHPTLNITWSNHDLRAVWDSPSIAYHVIHIGNPSLVGGLEHGFYFSIYIYMGITRPTDELIFFRGVAQPPTRSYMTTYPDCFERKIASEVEGLLPIFWNMFFFSRRLVSYQPFHLHGLVSTQTFNQLSVGA